MINVVFGLVVVGLGFSMVVTGAVTYFRARREEAGYFYWVGVIMMLAGSLWFLVASNEPKDCPPTTQLVEVQQIGTSSNVDLCLTDDQVSDFMESRSVR